MFEQEHIRDVLEVMDCSNIVNVLTEERMDKNERITRRTTD